MFSSKDSKRDWQIEWKLSVTDWRPAANCGYNGGVRGAAVPAAAGALAALWTLVGISTGFASLAACSSHI